MRHFGEADIDPAVIKRFFKNTNTLQSDNDPTWRLAVGYKIPVSCGKSKFIGK